MLDEDKIYNEMKLFYEECTKSEDFKPEIFFKGVFRIIEDAFREATQKDAEFEVIADIAKEIGNNTLLIMFLREILKQIEIEDISDLTAVKINEEDI